MRLQSAQEQLAKYDLLLSWATQVLQSESNVISVEIEAHNLRLAVRVKCEVKSSLALWITIRERSVYFECYFMPVGETNRNELYDYLLRKNSGLYPMYAAVGLEDAVYLVGRFAADELSHEKLDLYLGATLAATEKMFSQAMRISFGSRYQSTVKMR